MALVGQTITIVNKSGKVVSTSKHLVNVFNEAKTAYSERKAELKAARREKADRKDDERKARKRIETLRLSDDEGSSLSRRSSRRGSEDGRRSTEIRRKPVPRSDRPPIDRGVSDSFYVNDMPRTSRRSSHHRPSPLSRQHSSEAEDPHIRELTRRHTSGLELTSPTQKPRKPSRRASADDIDMDLAYGTLPPPLPERNYDTEIELRSKMTGLQRVLEEANCLQHSVTAIIDNLQKNPDALAAVALTLAEISSLVSKMAPGALMSLKGAFPAVVALLVSPEFMIAAGVGVGVTVVVLGGYKIVKKIKARKEAESGMLLEANPGGEAVGGIDRESEMESLKELSRIEQWRRGIADVEAESVGTSVEGEFVTPGAKTALLLEGKVTEADFKIKEKKKRKKHRSRSEVSGSTSASGTKVKSKKEPSGIRMLFKGKSEKGSGL